jgi:hypothetical protein
VQDSEAKAAGSGTPGPAAETKSDDGFREQGPAEPATTEAASEPAAEPAPEVKAVVDKVRACRPQLRLACVLPYEILM